MNKTNDHKLEISTRLLKTAIEGIGPSDGPVTLTRDRVYIVPTKAGLIFSLLLQTLLIGPINYEKTWDLF